MATPGPEKQEPKRGNERGESEERNDFVWGKQKTEQKKERVQTFGYMIM